VFDWGWDSDSSTPVGVVEALREDEFLDNSSFDTGIIIDNSVMGWFGSSLSDELSNKEKVIISIAIDNGIIN
jgi:hypothetical protein